MTSNSLSNNFLYDVFEATLSPDKSVRECAEQTLSDISSQHNDFVLHLIRFCCQPLSLPTDFNQTSDGISEEFSAQTGLRLQRDKNVQLAAAIRIHNVLGRSDWNRNAYFTEEVKESVRQLIVPIQCLPHVSEHVRRQLLVATDALIAYEFPKRWPQLMNQLERLLGEWSTALRAAVEYGGMHAQVLSVIVQMKAGLSILRCCCRVYEDPLKVDAAAVATFAGELIPSLINLAESLEELWSQELVRFRGVGVEHLEKVPGVKGVDGVFEARTEGGTGLLLEQSPLQTELSHCLCLVVKCFRSLCQQRWPKCLCDVALFRDFWTVCFTKPTGVAYAHYLPWCRRRLFEHVHKSDTHLEGNGVNSLSYQRHGDQFETFQEASLWRLLKWIGNISLKLLQDFMVPKSCEKQCRAVATFFCDTYLSEVVQAALCLVRWHSLMPTTEACAPRMPSVWLVTSKAYISALETVGLAVNHRQIYHKILHPVSEELVTVLLFPRLAFSTEDAELWTSNPEEYIRRQASPTGDIYNAKMVAVRTLLSLVAPKKKHMDAEFLPKFANFLMNQLQIYAPQALQARSEGEAGPAGWEAARRLDATLFCLYHFKKVLLSMQLGHEHLEGVLKRFVVPAMQSQLGFLRARAVLVLSTFATSIEWSSPEVYQTALRTALPLLDDSEAPVRIQACSCFASLACHPYARDVVTPCIAELIRHYFEIMRLMDSDSVVRTLRKTISFYQDSLSQWGLELADMIVSHFSHVAQTFSNKYDLLECNGNDNGVQESRGMSPYFEDEALADTLMAADELLETLITLVKVLPRSPWAHERKVRGCSRRGISASSPTEAELNEDLFVQMQERVAPMLFFILNNQSGSSFGFMDPALNLLTTLLTRSPCIAPVTWRLLPCLHHLVCHMNAIDYFAEMVPPIDNFISVSPQPFLTTPLGCLCGGEAQVPYFPSSVSSFNCTDGRVQNICGWTPAQILQDMCRAVLVNPNSHDREVSVVPKLYDSLMQSYWFLVFSSSPSSWIFSIPHSCFDAAMFGQATTFSFSEYIAKPIAQQVLFVLHNRSKMNSTLRILFCNTVFSCIMADLNSTLAVLQASESTYSFFEQYTCLVRDALKTSSVASPSSKNQTNRKAESKAKDVSFTAGGCAAVMRGYDRALFILAFSRSMGFLFAYHAHSEQQHGVGNLEALTILEASLAAIVESCLLEQFAQKDLDATVREVAFHVRRLQKWVSTTQTNTDKAQTHPSLEAVEMVAQAVARGLLFLKSHPRASKKDGRAGDLQDEEDEWFDEDSGSSWEDSCDSVSDDIECEESEDMYDEDDGNEDVLSCDHHQNSAMVLSLCTKAQNARVDVDHDPTLLSEANTSMDKLKTNADDHNDEFENFLEEEDFETPVDGVNAWAVLMDTLTASNAYLSQTTKGNLWDLIKQQASKNEFLEVRNAVDLLFLLRTQSAELIHK